MQPASEGFAISSVYNKGHESLSRTSVNDLHRGLGQSLDWKSRLCQSRLCPSPLCKSDIIGVTSTKPTAWYVTHFGAYFCAALTVPPASGAPRPFIGRAGPALPRLLSRYCFGSHSSRSKLETERMANSGAHGKQSSHLQKKKMRLAARRRVDSDYSFGCR